MKTPQRPVPRSPIRGTPAQRRAVALAGFLLLAGLAWGGWTVVRARRDLVSLEVRNMDVREVIRKIRWQTWEDVLVGKDVQGTVTLHIRNAPLPVALDLVAEQVSARSSRIYPLYHQRGALKQFRERVQQGADDSSAPRSWTNLTARGGFGPGFGGGGGRGFGPGFGPGGPDNDPAAAGITLKVEVKDAPSVARTLSAACRAQVVPEDGVDMKLSLEIQGATPEQAIDQFARALFCRVEGFYVLQAGGGGRGERRGPPEGLDEDAMRERMAARLEALSPEQRARIEEMRNLSPEERQAQMQARMEDPAVQESMANRSLNSIRNSTPEQIVQRKRDRMQRMQMMQSSGQDPQRTRPGPPGGGPPP